MHTQAESFEEELRLSQSIPSIEFHGERFDRVPYGSEPGAPPARPFCPGCMVGTGLLHLLGCHVERCPRCKVGSAGAGCNCGMN